MCFYGNSGTLLSYWLTPTKGSRITVFQIFPFQRHIVELFQIENSVAMAQDNYILKFKMI